MPKCASPPTKIQKKVKRSISLFFKDIYLALLPSGPAAAGSRGEGSAAVSGARNVGFVVIVVLPFPETVRVGLQNYFRIIFFVFPGN